MYAKGYGVIQNHLEAAKWYRLAADQGHSFARNTLAAMYKKGQGVPRDYVESLKWYVLAAEQGHFNYQASFNIGLMYLNGYGVDRNYSEALSWFLHALHQWSYTWEDGDLPCVPNDLMEHVNKAIKDKTVNTDMGAQKPAVPQTAVTAEREVHEPRWRRVDTAPSPSKISESAVPIVPSSILKSSIKMMAILVGSIALVVGLILYVSQSKDQEIDPAKDTRDVVAVETGKKDKEQEIPKLKERQR
jgi:hypothetical protein